MELEIITLMTSDEGQTILQDFPVQLRGDDIGQNDRPRMSTFERGKGFLFMEFPAEYEHGFELFDKRHLGVCLSGSIVFETEDGDHRTVGPGQSWRFMEASAKGLKLKVIGDEPFRFVILQLD